MRSHKAFNPPHSLPRTRLSFHTSSHPHNPTFPTDILNISSSFLNISFQTNPHEKTTLGSTTVTTIENKDTSRSNTTVKHKEIIDKENISPIKYCQNPKNGQKNGKMVKNQPPPLWFLKKSTTNNNNIGNNVRNNNINNNNYSGINSNKSMLKSEENSFAFLTEEEKMLNTRKKLEEDLKKSMMDYESNSKTVQSSQRIPAKKAKVNTFGA